MVTQNITENTVWQNGKEYVVEGVVTVEQGVFLNITGEVTVKKSLDKKFKKLKKKV